MADIDNETVDGGRKRLNPESAIIDRKWFQSNRGESFEGNPQHLDKIAARIKKEINPKTFEEFWDHLVVKM